MYAASYGPKRGQRLEPFKTLLSPGHSVVRRVGLLRYSRSRSLWPAGLRSAPNGKRRLRAAPLRGGRSRGHPHCSPRQHRLGFAIAFRSGPFRTNFGTPGIAFIGRSWLLRLAAFDKVSHKALELVAYANQQVRQRCQNLRPWVLTTKILTLRFLYPPTQSLLYFSRLYIGKPYVSTP